MNEGARAISKGLEPRADYMAYRQYIRKPETFHIAKVQKETKNRLIKSGYQATKKGVLIPLHTVDGSKFDSAKIEKGKIVYKGKTLSGKTITEKVTLVDAPDFHSELKRISKTKLKKNQSLTVKIGDNASFSTRFNSYADLYKYINHDFKPKGTAHGKKVKARDLLRYISIVEIEENGPKKSQPKRKNSKKGKK